MNEGLVFREFVPLRIVVKLTPTERLKAAQDFINTVIRIRAQNGD